MKLYLSMWVMAVVLLVVTATAHAWWATGHMAVAEIARRNLNEDVLEKVEACAAVLSKMGPYPKSPDFIQTAPWADDLKAMGQYSMSTWHFVDIPYNPDKVAIPVCAVDKVNVQNAIDYMVKAIRHSGASAEMIVTSLANLAHFVGDIHQPLHATALFSAKYPKGDAGGNKEIVYLSEDGKSMKLHAFWDSMGQGPQADPPRPLSAKNAAKLNDFVDYLVATYTFTEKEKTVTKPATMAKESFDAAVKYVYPGASDGAILTAEYQATAKSVCERRVTLAGYRLATIINKAMKDVPLTAIMAGVKLITEEVADVSVSRRTCARFKDRSIGVDLVVGLVVSSFLLGCFALAVITGERPRRRKSPRSGILADDEGGSL